MIFRGGNRRMTSLGQFQRESMADSFAPFSTEEVLRLQSNTSFRSLRQWSSRSSNNNLRVPSHQSVFLQSVPVSQRGTLGHFSAGGEPARVTGTCKRGLGGTKSL